MLPHEYHYAIPQYVFDTIPGQIRLYPQHQNGAPSVIRFSCKIHEELFFCIKHHNKTVRSKFITWFATLNVSSNTFARSSSLNFL